MQKNKHVWVVLAGSGMRMYAFLGALKAAAEMGYTFEGVTGTSGGALIAGLLAKHWDPNDPVGSCDRMIAEAETIDTAKLLKKSFRWRFWEWAFTSWWKKGAKGIFTHRKLLKLMRKKLPKRFKDAKLPTHIVALQVNLKSPRPVVFKNPNDDLPLAVMGSMCLPVFDPVKYGPALLEDGGWVRNLAIPEDKKQVLAFYFEELGDDNPGTDLVLDKKQMIPIATNVTRLMSIIEGVLETNMREAIKEAEEEGVEIQKVILRGGIGSFDFFASKEETQHAIMSGYLSAMEKLKG